MRFSFYCFFAAWIAVAAGSSIGQNTQGFFLDGFRPKSATIPPHQDVISVGLEPTVAVNVFCADTVAAVSPWLYGNNANVYMGQMVTEPVLMRHVQTLSPRVLRYPGGNLSNLFFWNSAPGHAPQDAPDSLIVNGRPSLPNYWFGRSEDTLNLSVDNYYRMLDRTQSTGVICVNYGYARYGTGPDPAAAAAHLAAEWVRYDNGRTRFWEIGNENYGPWQAGMRIDTTANRDGQPRRISGELYGKHFLVFADSMRAAAKGIGADIRLGAVIVENEKGPEWYNPIEARWNEGFFKSAGNAADFFSIHSYFTPFNDDSKPSVILESAAVETARMRNDLTDLCAKSGVNLKPLALTEWNTFAVRSRQCTSFINGLHAALVLGELAQNRFGMACRWDLVNRYEDGNDHGMFNYGDEPGVPRWNPRPAFFTMFYFQKFFGDHMVSSTVSTRDSVAVYASRFHSGHAGLVVVNKSMNDETIQINLNDFKPGKRFYLYSLTGGKDNGAYSQQVFINGVNPDYPTGGPVDQLEKIPARSGRIRDGIRFASPAHSAQFVLIEGK